MTKILLWVGIVFAVLLGLRLLNVAKARRRSGATGPRNSAGGAETMVRCTGCGVYLPQADATAGPKGPTCGEPACVRGS